MNILFLVYWGFNDGLTTATVMPHIRILENNEKIDDIILCTIERDQMLNERRLDDKVLHIPWISSHRSRDKIRDFVHFPRKIAQIIREKEIGFVFCRGTPAGAIGYLAHCKTGIDYAVESFEPHGDYMVESGVWSRWGLKYLLQSYWEKKQIETARFIMPVARHYYDHLINKGVDSSKLFLMPCAVDLAMFAFNSKSRISVRSALGLDVDAAVGVYVGKFGGMYYDEEAFEIFALARKYLDKFHLIILSPDNPSSVKSKLLRAGYLSDQFHIKNVPHSEVPLYLSASDFAFATYKPGNSKKYLSPIKVGEYWAAGLPVLLTEGIGDDAAVIANLNIGSVFSSSKRDLEKAYLNLRQILTHGRGATNMRIQPVAERYRSFTCNERVYNNIIDAIA